MRKIEQDKHTIIFMVEFYSRHKLHQNELSNELKELIDYACARLERCKYGIEKPACKNCPTHCYKPDMRQKIREVMRWSGPRMIFFAPLAAIRHLMNK